MIKNKKGFTLVEVIVVLVILAILAALMIPTMAKYIDKAQQGDYIMMARGAIDAAQCIVAEKYAEGVSFDSWRGFTNITDRNPEIMSEIYELCEVDKNKYVIANVDVNANGRVIFVNIYSKSKVNGQNNRVVYMNGIIGGKTYNSEFVVSCWNGEIFREYRTLDPGQVGYKKG